MARRRLILTLILFLFATLAAAPVAFHAGLAHGARFLAPIEFIIDYRRLTPEATADFWHCRQLSGFPGLRQFDRIQDCRPQSDGAAKPVRLASSGNLSRATAAAIARIPVIPASASPSAQAGPGGVSGVFGGPALVTASVGAPGDNANAPGVFPPGLPSNIIPYGAFGGSPGSPLPVGPGPEGPASETPGEDQAVEPELVFELPDEEGGPTGPPAEPLTTPLPPALPLFLAGLFGLRALSRRR